MKALSIISIVLALMLIIGASGCQKAAEQGGISNQSVSANETETAQTLSGTIIVNIRNSAFNPSEVTITKGSRIIWKNLDSVMHTVTFDKNQVYYINYQIQPGKEASDYFNYAGNYSYHCSVHPSMKGKVTVK